MADNTKERRFARLRYILIVVLIEICILCESLDPCILLDENQWLYVLSTIAQVMAAMLGLSFAGYQFYGNRFPEMIKQDDSIKESIDILQKYLYQKWKILSWIGFIDIFLSVGSMISWKIRYFQLITNVLFNNSVFWFVISLVLIARFILDNMNPVLLSKLSDMEGNSLEQSELLGKTNHENKSQISEKEAQVDNFTEFMQYFVEIEQKIIEASDKLRKHYKLHIYNRPINLADRIEIIGMYHGDLAGILKEVDTLRKYRNYLVHGTGKKAVPLQGIDRIKSVSLALYNALSKYDLLQEK